jgi:anti-sigma factor RsiW
MSSKQIKNQRSKIGNEVMSCDEIQQSLSLYVDDGLTPAARVECYRHLEVCPVCRARLAEMRSIRSGLAMLSRPAPPADLVPSINKALMAAAAAQPARRNTAFGDVVAAWLQPVAMRYAFSSLASVIIFTCVFAALRPHMIALHEAALAFEQIPIISYPDDPFRPAYDITKPISPESYVALRNPYNVESPSLNPGGALAALTSEPTRLRDGRRGDDDMMVVADVFSNGSASLADVVHAPRDRRMLDEFEKALRTDAAFVPAALDRRPGTMRVVFSIQRVDVRDRNY